MAACLVFSVQYRSDSTAIKSIKMGKEEATTLTILTISKSLNTMTARLEKERMTTSMKSYSRVASESAERKQRRSH